MSEAERERRIRRMVVLADRMHGAAADRWVHRRTSTRLRRLARRATAEDVAEVRDRVARAVTVVAEVVPAAAGPAGANLHEQVSTPPADGDDNPADAVTTGHARGSDTSQRRTPRARRRSTAERVARVLARRPDAKPAEVAAKLGVSERTAQRNWPDRNGHAVNGQASLPDAAAIHAGHSLTRSGAGQEQS